MEPRARYDQTNAEQFMLFMLQHPEYKYSLEIGMDPMCPGLRVRVYLPDGSGNSIYIGDFFTSLVRDVTNPPKIAWDTFYNHLRRSTGSMLRILAEKEEKKGTEEGGK
jgi:hypothetical protein